MSMLLVANCSSTHRKPPKTKPQVMMEPPRMWSLRKRLILSASYSCISSEAITLQLNSQWAASVYQWHTNKFPSPLKIDSRDQSSRKQSPSRDHHPHDDHHRDLCASCLSFRREEKRIPSHYKCLYAFFKLCIPSHPIPSQRWISKPNDLSRRMNRSINFKFFFQSKQMFTIPANY